MPPLKKRILFAIIMALFTVAIMVTVMLGVNMGFGSELFWRSWLRSYAIAYLTIVPVILLLGPQVQRLVDWIMRP